MFTKTTFYSVKKTVITEANGKKTTTTEVTSTDKKPKDVKKFENIMDKFIKLMDEL